jgi:sugar-specific transcriptional regulator TrmB
LEQDDRETLELLGLSPLQICLYVKLIELGKATVKSLSKNSGVARADIYRTMSSLYKLGIVQKFIANPVMFEAVLPEQALSILLDKKINETIALGEKTSNLIQTLNNRAIVNTKEVESDIVLIPASKIVFEKFISLINNAEKSVDLLLTYEHYEYLLNVIALPIQKAIKRGVQARIIIENNQQTKPTLEHRQFMKSIKNKEVCLRFISIQPSAVFSIYDQRELLLPINSTALPHQTPVLYSNNTSIVSLSSTYFEHLMREAEDSIRSSSNTKLVNFPVLKRNFNIAK